MSDKTYDCPSCRGDPETCDGVCPTCDGVGTVDFDPYTSVVITTKSNWLQDLMSRIDFIALELMRAAGVATNNHAVKPYWKKLAVWMQDFCLHPDAVQIAKDLCSYHGADPEQKSLGLGSVIARDQEYRLWQAWTPLSDAYIKACSHYDKRG